MHTFGGRVMVVPCTAAGHSNSCESSNIECRTQVVWFERHAQRTLVVEHQDVRLILVAT